MALNMLFYICLLVCLKVSAETESERAFSAIYQEGAWGRNAQGEAISGGGSTLLEGRPFIEYVQDFLDHSADVHSIVDIGCGDWVLAREIRWGQREYLGTDVVKSVVLKNQLAFGTNTVRFAHLDGVVDEIPSADLLICKDVFMHLPNSFIFTLLPKFKQSKYCILVYDVMPETLAKKKKRRKNSDTYAGGYRTLDLTLAPFFLHPIKTSYYYSGKCLKQILLLQNY